MYVGPTKHITYASYHQNQISTTSQLNFKFGTLKQVSQEFSKPALSCNFVLFDWMLTSRLAKSNEFC
jgi:hypothetical protein